MNWLLLKNSLFVSALATALAVSFGLVSAIVLAGVGRRTRSFLLALAVFALALPPFLVTNCWLDLLGYTGVWRSWLPLNIFSLGGAVWILALLLWPLTLFAVSSAWRRLEPAQLESDPAVSGWPLIRNLLFPLARSAIAQAAVLTFVLALNNFAVPAILQVKVFPAEMWIRFNTTFDTPGTLRLSWLLILAPMLLVLWFYRRQIPWPSMERPVPPGLFRRQLGKPWFITCLLGTAGICLLSVGLPLFELASVRRTWTELPGAWLAGQSAVWNSFVLPVLSATVVLVISLLAIAAFRSRIFGSLLWFSFLVPGVLLGMALIALFNHAWSSAFYQSIGVVVLAFAVRYLALGWNTLAHASDAVDPQLREAARLEGANFPQMLRWVYWPQMAPQILAAWYIVFLLCLWDVESIILIVPPGGETLALRIFNLLHYGHNAQVNALCLVLLGVAISPLILFCLFRLIRLTAFPLRLSLSLLPLLLLTSCSPHSDSNRASLQSLLFKGVEIFGKRGVGVGELNKPRSVAVDMLDNLYTVDMTGRVQKFSPNGVFQLLWQMPQTDLGKPKGMGRDREGDIIVVEPHYQRVNFFSTEGKLLAQFGHKGTNDGQLSMPRAVAVDSKHEIFLSEYGEVERVQKFMLQTNGVARWLATFGKPGNAPGEFNRPEGICLDSQDRLYVADSCNHRIQVFTSDGKFLRAYGGPGSGKGQFSYPYDICVDSAGRQYVCEFGNSRIQVFDANDQPLEIIGGPGAEPGQFANPWGVALDSAGNLYVADSQNHRVQKLLRR